MGRTVSRIESGENVGNDVEAGDRGILGRAGEKGLQANADAHEGLAGVNVGTNGGEEAGARELAETVAKVADSREDEFLARGVREREREGKQRLGNMSL